MIRYTITIHEAAPGRIVLDTQHTGTDPVTELEATVDDMFKGAHNMVRRMMGEQSTLVTEVEAPVITEELKSSLATTHEQKVEAMNPLNPS